MQIIRKFVEEFKFRVKLVNLIGWVLLQASLIQAGAQGLRGEKCWGRATWISGLCKRSDQ